MYCSPVYRVAMVTFVVQKLWDPESMGQIRGIFFFFLGGGGGGGGGGGWLGSRLEGILGGIFGGPDSGGGGGWRLEGLESRFGHAI